MTITSSHWLIDPTCSSDWLNLSPRSIQKSSVHIPHILCQVWVLVRSDEAKMSFVNFNTCWWSMASRELESPRHVAIQLSRNLSLSRKSQTLAEKSENRTEPIPRETLYSPFGNFMNIKKSRSNLYPESSFSFVFRIISGLIITNPAQVETNEGSLVIIRRYLDNIWYKMEIAGLLWTLDS